MFFTKFNWDRFFEKPEPMFKQSAKTQDKSLMDELHKLRSENLKLIWKCDQLEKELWYQGEEEVKLRETAYKLAKGFSVDERIEAAENIFTYLTRRRNERLDSSKSQANE